MSSTNAPSQNDEQQQPKTYKEQLDEAATNAKTSENDASQGGLVNTVVEKGERKTSHACRCVEEGLIPHIKSPNMYLL